MTIEKVSYAGSPERVTEENFDCVWVQFAPRKTPTPLVSPVLQWVDWRLQGRLSRFLLEGKRSKHTTFLPTQKRIGSPMVALEPPGDLDWKGFSENCRGMGIKRVLILCEGADEVAALEKEVRRQSDSGLETVVLGSDGPVGRA